MQFAVAAVLCGGVLSAENADLEWIDAVAFVEGRGFADAATYGRLPKRAWEAEGIDKVLTMGNHATRLALRFTTDSETLKFRYTLKSASKDDAWCGWAGLYGVDVYGWDVSRGAWRFERVGRGKARDVNQEWNVRSKWTSGQPCLVYLPFRGEVEKFEIGVDRGAAVRRVGRVRSRGCRGRWRRQRLRCGLRRPSSRRCAARGS